MYLGLLISKTLFGCSEKLALVEEEPQQTLSGAIHAVNYTVSFLRSIRTEEYFNSLWADMINAQKKHGLQLLQVLQLRRVPKLFEHSQEAAEPARMDTQQLLRKI